MLTPIWVALLGPAVGALIAIIGIVITSLLTSRRERQARVYERKSAALLDLLAAANALRDKARPLGRPEPVEELTLRFNDAALRVGVFASESSCDALTAVRGAATALRDRGWQWQTTEYADFTAAIADLQYESRRDLGVEVDRRTLSDRIEDVRIAYQTRKKLRAAAQAPSTSVAEKQGNSPSGGSSSSKTKVAEQHRNDPA